MALNFPGSPSDNDRYSANGIEYYYSASVGAWLVVVPSLTANTLNLQIAFNDSGFANGSNGLLFDKGANTFYTNTAIVTNNVTAQFFIGDGSALTGIAGGGPAFDKANAANILAESAYTYAANNAMLAANSAYAKANAANITADSTYTFAANTVRLIANSAFAAGNSNYTFAANTVRLIANSAYAAQNTTYGYAANQVMLAANSAYAAGNSNYTFAANTVRLIANSAYAKANAANVTADATYTFSANTVRLIANSAYAVANLANQTANNAFSNTSGSVFNGDMFIKGNLGVGLYSTTYMLEVAGSFAAQTKSFLITHPSDPNRKLQYASLEGPENGVYVRGKLTGSTTISLPPYWYDLVDPNSITVNLTPYSFPQPNLHVSDVYSSSIYLSESAWCYYIVYAERKDVPKLVVEF